MTTVKTSKCEYCGKAVAGWFLIKGEIICQTCMRHANLHSYMEEHVRLHHTLSEDHPPVPSL